jgi:CcmD family protein
MMVTDQTTPTKTPEERSTEFVAVQGGNEGTSAESLLVAAYLVMWAALITFIFVTWRRQGALEKRLEKLDRDVRQTLGKT